MDFDPELDVVQNVLAFYCEVGCKGIVAREMARSSQGRSEGMKQ